MDLLDGERVLWHGNPSWKSLLLFYVKWTIISLIPLALWYLWDATADDAPSAILVTLTVLALVATFVGGWIKRATTRYRVTDKRINVRTGLIARHDASTHLDRVQNVNINQTAFQRLLGVGNIDWDTAGTDSGDADFTFYGVDDPSGLMHVVDTALHASSSTGMPRTGGI
jgi:uncharacterized membrane protein YdbT with pleckstrin-like domain